jgi:hypothetical protein
MTLHANSAIATLRSDEPPATGQTVTKPVNAGNYITVPVGGDTSYGLGFLPVSAGTVFVSVTGPPGLVSTSQSSVMVTITP